MKLRLYFCAIGAALLLGLEAALAQLSGHGGPVRALAISADGKSVLSGSFDTSAIRWSLGTESAEQVLRFHSGAVNAVIFLQDGRMATAGADARIAIWTVGRQQPDEFLEGHRAPIVGLAVSADGSTLASASWDSTVRLWPLHSGAKRVLEGHSQNVNGVAFGPDGKSLVSVGYDLTLRIWPLPDWPAGGHHVSITAECGGSRRRRRDRNGRRRRIGAPSSQSEPKQIDDVQAGPGPVVALAVSPDGAFIAAAEYRRRSVNYRSQGAKRGANSGGPGTPVWSEAFLPDSATLLTGGADGMIRRWNVLTGEPIGSSLRGTPADPLAAYAGDHGAEIFRACVACHTLSEKDNARAGPTLAGLFGRRIASLPGYRFSDALKGMDIVWTPETVAKLFEVGPNAYTPGTKMPEQRIGSPEDRKALTDFLARATAR